MLCKNVYFFLIRPEGAKYKKAKEWQTSVVNAQWLTDILCGQMVALHQIESPKYQQFNLGNPFKLDYAAIPHLMGTIFVFIFKLNLKRNQ